MKFKKFGKTGKTVSAIGQGTMGVGGYLSRDTSHDLEYIKNIQYAFDLGITFIDTAEGYGEGHAEELIGIALAGIRDQAFIASKVSPENAKYEDVIKACDQSLKRLKTDYMDLFQIHWPHPGVSVNETLSAMNSLRQQGKIRFIGVSNFSLEQLKVAQLACGDIISSVQTEYNLFDRSIENNLLSYCIEQELTVIAYSPLNQGKASFNAKQIAMLNAIGKRCGMTAEQIALNWVIAHEGVVAIPKAVKLEHIRQNSLAADFDLEPEDFAAIEGEFKTIPINIPVEKIKVAPDGQGNRFVYQTIEAAIQNKMGFCPSPCELASDLQRHNEEIKPVRVRKTRDTSGRYEYDLVEGRIRYWAWVIAHKGLRPIKALSCDINH
jgi:aryl-alcohol dehydrogenase-like predicted oxidoreductase